MRRLGLMSIAVAASACGGGEQRARSEQAPTAIVISVAWPGASAANVESGVANPLEEALASAGEVAHLRSTIERGEVSIAVEPRAGVSVDALATVVRERLTRVRAELPPAALPPVLTTERRGGTIGRYLLKSSAPVGETTGVHAWRSEIDRMPGVRGQSNCGVGRGRIAIYVDAPRLAALGIGADELVAGLQAAYKQRPPTAGVGEGLDALPVGTAALRDVATIERGHEAACHAYTSIGEGALGTIVLDEGAPRDTFDKAIAAARGHGLDVAPLLAPRRIAGELEVSERELARPLRALLEALRPIPEVKWASAEVAVQHGHVLFEVGVERDGNVDAIAAAITRATASAQVAPPRLGARDLTAFELVVRGPDLTALRARADAAVTALRATPGISAAGCTPCHDESRLELEVDRDRAADVGVHLDVMPDVARFVLGELTLEDRTPYVVRVQLPGDDVAAKLQAIHVRGATGLVPLASLLRANTVPVSRITHEDRERAIVVWARGTDVTAVQAALRKVVPGVALRPTPAP